MLRRVMVFVFAVQALAVAASCDDEESDGCKADADCKGDRICEDGTCVSPDTGASETGESSGAGSSSGDGSGSDTAGEPESCAQTQTYCDGNVLYSCSTDAVIVDCATCKYVGPGSGSEYDTSCKAQESDCSTCDAENPWDGAGCYFGGGPAVCRS